MKIVEVREKTISIASEIKNAFIDFSTMTVSILVLYTNVIREDRPVVGYGFNSNRRYSQGCLYGGMRADLDIPQMDPVLSYGLVEYLPIIEVC
jgi:hypothetical protein